MSDFLTNLKAMNNYTKTENGAVALKSTLNPVLDAFGSLAAMKDRPEAEILRMWNAAYQADPVLSMRLLFYIRDIRGGQGMRRVFRVIARNMALVNPDLMSKNLDNILFFGRGDDVLCLLDTPAEKSVLEWIDSTIKSDVAEIVHEKYPTMLAKWLPSINASSPITRAQGRKIAKGLGLTEKEYRVTLSALRKKIGIVETLMSQNRWDEIDFEKVPSRAAMIYSDAFINHVRDNYVEYLQNVATGKAKVNANALFPVDIIHKVAGTSRLNLKDTYLLTAMWNALPNYFEGKEETGLCVIDTSGSMWGTPLEVAVSLGMYCADKAKGPFHGHFITFSNRPELQAITGQTIVDKYNGLIRAGWDMNTNLEAVFDLILKTAVANNMAPKDLPTKLYIVSDMQFDDATTNRSNYYWRSGSLVVGNRNTFMDSMKEKYAQHGYTLPAIVYWNVDARNTGMFQTTFQGENCAMVSGYSPSLFKAVIEGTQLITETVTNSVTGETKTVEKQVLDPLVVMNTALMAERYNRVITQ